MTYEAFLTLDYPGRQRMDEHFLVSLLRESEFVLPELCFVLEQDGEIVGHILYTRSKILSANGTKTQVMEKARELGHGAVLIVDVPDYYPKLGFKRARDYGLTLPDGTSPDAFMAYELQPGYLSSDGVFCELAPEFDRAEHDDIGYAAFHRWFMAIHELNNRHGEYSEDWLKVDTPGVMFSIDYLIGKPEHHLHKGVGQKMIAMLLDVLRERNRLQSRVLITH